MPLSPGNPPPTDYYYLQPDLHTYKYIHLTIIVAYTPMEPSEEAMKDAFYDQLSATCQSTPPHDILVVLGDFNAVSGTNDNGCGIVSPLDKHFSPSTTSQK